VKFTDQTGATTEKTQERRQLVENLLETHFSAAERARFEKEGVSVVIKDLPEDIAGQSMEDHIFFEPDTIDRADGVTEDVVVHEFVHRMNRIREKDDPATYLRRESTSNAPADVQKDIQIEEAVTEAITSARLEAFDRTGAPVARSRGDLNKRYNRAVDVEQAARERYERMSKAQLRRLMELKDPDNQYPALAPSTSAHLQNDRDFGGLDDVPLEITMFNQPHTFAGIDVVNLRDDRGRLREQVGLVYLSPDGEEERFSYEEINEWARRTRGVPIWERQLSESEIELIARTTNLPYWAHGRNPYWKDEAGVRSKTDQPDVKTVDTWAEWLPLTGFPDNRFAKDYYEEVVDEGIRAALKEALKTPLKPRGGERHILGSIGGMWTDDEIDAMPTPRLWKMVEGKLPPRRLLSIAAAGEQHFESMGGWESIAIRVAELQRDYRGAGDRTRTGSNNLPLGGGGGWANNHFHQQLPSIPLSIRGRDEWMTVPSALGRREPTIRRFSGKDFTRVGVFANDRGLVTIDGWKVSGADLAHLLAERARAAGYLARTVPTNRKAAAMLGGAQVSVFVGPKRSRTWRRGPPLVPPWDRSVKGRRDGVVHRNADGVRVVRWDYPRPTWLRASAGRAASAPHGGPWGGW
jgi:hypothetical protein